MASAGKVKFADGDSDSGESVVAIGFVSLVSIRV